MLKSLYPFLIIKPIHTERKTKSGIILGEEYGQSSLLHGGMSTDSLFSYIADIVYCPDGIEEIKIGERVVYFRFNAREISEELLVIDQSDIIAKLEVEK